MTKKQVVEILKEMDCEIAKVQICLTNKTYYDNVIVYLVSEPSNDDQIINANHWWIFNSIKEFDSFFNSRISKNIQFLDVTEFVSDFKKQDRSN